jgi:hypothetical protein
MEDAILKEIWAAKDRIGERYRGNVKKYMDNLRAAHKASAIANGRPRKAAIRSKRKSA